MGRKNKKNKNISLPMAREGHRQRLFVDGRLRWRSAKEVGLATLQASTWHGFADGLTARLSAKGTTSVAIYPGPSLPMAVLCRQPGRRQRMPLPMAFFADDRAVGKEVFTDGWSWPSVKVDLCRRRIPWPSAKSLAVGKVAVSGSDYAISSAPCQILNLKWHAVSLLTTSRISQVTDDRGAEPNWLTQVGRRGSRNDLQSPQR
jgi:hypothetical protein